MALLMAAGSEPVTEREMEDLDAIAALKESPASEFMVSYRAFSRLQALLFCHSPLFLFPICFIKQSGFICRSRGNKYVKMGKHYSDAGVVYKGVLENGMAAAVKKLEDVRQGGEEFWGEVSVIGRIYHMNLVRTWGFCSEDLHRLLVCEFVENGSLEKALFDPNKLLGWKERFQIAVGVARGLAYLHHECLEWVIHCDVKPENILLDRNYEPKIADFGLAKLLNRGVVGSNLSRIRGTRGYIAPEWASNLPITGKIDVYSYGVVLLELVSGSRVSDLVMKGVTEMMAMKTMCAKLGRNLERGGVNWVGSFVDMRLKGEFDSNQAVRMVKVAVSCLGEEGSRRPTMETVVQMLHSGDEEFYSDATDSLQF